MPVKYDKETHVCKICNVVEPTKRFLVCHGICRACRAKQYQSDPKNRKKILKDPMSKKEITLRGKIKAMEKNRKCSVLNKLQGTLTSAERAQCAKWAKIISQIADMIIPVKI